MRNNQMQLQFLSLSQNESFARSVAAAFASQMNPTVEELSDIRTAVSEAVTNAIIHGYENHTDGLIVLACSIEGNKFTASISDKGCGISDIPLARKPFYTTRPELERSGMGFAVMEAFMEDVSVTSKVGEGTTVVLQKTILHNG